MLVAYHLTSSSTGRTNAQTINYIVKTRLKELKQNLTGNTLTTLCSSKEQTELTLEYAISVLSFLLFSELITILGIFLTAIYTVLARSVIALIEHFIRAEDSLAKSTRDT